ncbi:MAG TPA: hypothetical protein VGH64_07290, partial [Puia sp.]
MKFFLLLVFTQAFTTANYGRDINIDSLISHIEESPGDTASINRLLQYSNGIAFSDPASALRIDLKVIEMARTMHNARLEAGGLNSAGEDNHFLGNYTEALKMQFEALKINRNSKDVIGEGETLGFIGVLYNELSEYRQALEYLIPSDSICQKIPGPYKGCFVLANIGDAYNSLNMPDSALYYIRESYFKFANPGRSHLRSYLLEHMGGIYAQFGKTDSALFFFRSAVLNSLMTRDQLNLSISLKKIADVYTTRGIYDSGLHYAHQAFDIAQSIPSDLHMLRAADLLSVLYSKTHKTDSVLFYLRTVLAMKDSLYGPDKYRKLQILLLDEQQSQNSIRQKEQEFRNRIKYILLVVVLAIFLLLAFIFWRANRLKQKANILLGNQKNKIEETLAELKSTQSQLIQSEKMASLGELTAGIAHEIQNPMNFVNNFSEVNAELIEELEKEAAAGNMSEVKSLAKDIRENEEKIIHHGKRADAIVKAMLQHSQSGSGKKEPVDINNMAGEYLSLASHGFRAKEKLFNATIRTDFDKTIGPVHLVPQDMGRVLLNLYNNAFYAVSEKKRQIPDGYEPTVFVRTKQLTGKIEIRIRDNGNGIR